MMVKCFDVLKQEGVSCSSRDFKNLSADWPAVQTYLSGEKGF